MHTISSYRGKTHTNAHTHTHTHTNKQTHRQDRLQYTAPQLSVNKVTTKMNNSCFFCKSEGSTGYRVGMTVSSGAL